MYESEELWRAKGGGSATSAALIGWLVRLCLVLIVAAGGVLWLLTMRGETTEVAQEPVLEGQSRVTSGRQAEVETGVDRELVLRKGANGHFLVKAHVNGVETNFLVDTGASDVALTAEDAKRIGINAGKLKYTREYQTANGIIRAAPLTLRDVRIGQLRIRNVEATVTDAPMGISLLGMSFLGELAGYEVRGDRMILRW